MNRGNAILTEVYPNNLHTKRVSLEPLEIFVNTIKAYKKYHDINLHLLYPFIYGARIRLSSTRYKIYAYANCYIRFINTQSYYEMIITDKGERITLESIDETGQIVKIKPVVFYKGAYIDIIFLFQSYYTGIIHDYSVGQTTYKYLPNSNYETNNYPYLLNNYINAKFFDNLHINLRFAYIYTDVEILSIQPIKNYSSKPNHNEDIQNIALSALNLLITSNTDNHKDKTDLLFNHDYKNIFYINVKYFKNKKEEQVFGGAIETGIDASYPTSIKHKISLEDKNFLYFYIHEENHNYSSATGGAFLFINPFNFPSNVANKINYTIPLITTNNLKTSGIVFENSQNGYKISTQYVSGEFIRNAWLNNNYAMRIAASRYFYNPWNLNKITSFFSNSISKNSNFIIFNPGASIHWENAYDVPNKKKKDTPFIFNPLLCSPFIFGNRKYFYNIIFMDNSKNYETSKQQNIKIRMAKYNLGNPELQFGALVMRETVNNNPTDDVPLNQFSPFIAYISSS